MGASAVLVPAARRRKRLALLQPARAHNLSALGCGHRGNALARPKVERRTAEDLENKGLWLGLRKTTTVWMRAGHRRRYGHDPLASSERADAAKKCVDADWLSVTPDSLRLTVKGCLFADEVSSRLWLVPPLENS